MLHDFDRRMVDLSVDRAGILLISRPGGVRSEKLCARRRLLLGGDFCSSMPH